MRSLLSRITAAVAGAIVATSISGCWVPMAIQAAPVALQAAGGIGTSAISWAEANQAHSPGVIEMRADWDGTPEYRELRLDTSADEPRWTPVIDKGAGADGWRPAVNLLQMSFTPPLDRALAASGSHYVAYTPADTESAEAKAQLLNFTEAFGTPAGTFISDGRLYNYSLPPALPALEFD